METLRVGDLLLEFALTGPRVTGLRVADGRNLFASLPGVVIERGSGAPFRFLGGHRLWRAPEVPAVTYAPDDEPVTFERGDVWLHARGAPDPDGIVREMRAGGDGGFVSIDHRLINVGREPVETAPWSITQLPADGTAVMPLTAPPVDGEPYQANRAVALWPYTDLGAPGLAWSRDAVVVRGSAGPMQKIGTENRTGWLAYLHDGWLFAKWGPIHDPHLAYADRGASAQIYRDHRVIELETLGPLERLEPGGVAEHREWWRVLPVGEIAAEDVEPVVFGLVAGLEAPNDGSP
jgi:hypothetical protein